MPRILCPAAAAVLLLAGCGGGSAGGGGGEMTLLLDFQPNAVHAGIYTATARDFDGAEGVQVEIRKPPRAPDAPKLLASGGADLAILDIHDLALAVQGGADLVGVMAIVQRPLAAVLARPGIRSPKALAGRRVGVTGLPSDVAVLRSVVEGAGGDPRRVRQVTIGFDAVRALLTGRVDAATAFWNAEGVALRARRPAFREFRVDDFGAPSYPELVLVTTRSTLEDRRDDVRAAVRAIQRGYAEVLLDPESAVSTMLSAEPDLERSRLADELDAVAPAFTGGGADHGLLDRRRLDEWVRWDVEFGILERPIDVGRAFDTSIARPADR